MQYRLSHPALAVLIAFIAPAVCRCATATEATAPGSPASHCHTPAPDGQPGPVGHSHGADPCDCPAHVPTVRPLLDQPAAPLSVDWLSFFIGLTPAAPVSASLDRPAAATRFTVDIPPPASISLHGLAALFLI